MAKKSDAKRKAKLKERRKQAEAAQSKTLAAPSEVGAWFAAHDAEPNIMAELVTEDGALFAYVEGDGNEWTLIVEDNPVAGTSDEIVALGMLFKRRSRWIGDWQHKQVAFLAMARPRD